MAKKSDSFYFGNFYACADCAYQAAHLLERVMRDFDPLLIREKLDDMHKVEHAADEKKHEVLDALVKAFITPIEREDIILLSQNIDEVTDKIEDVMLRLYYNNIQSIRPDSLELVSIVVKSCDMVKLMLKEFASFPPLQEPAGPHHRHQHPGGAGGSGLCDQHAGAAHHLHRPGGDHLLAGGLFLP